MTDSIRTSLSLSVIAFSLQTVGLAQIGVAPPRVPQELRPPAGHVAYLKGSAVGTQNYVCVPDAKGPAWKFAGPQATLYLTFPWMQGEGQQEIATHYLSPNPEEGGTPRPAWQHSFDSSKVWAKAAVTYADQDFVAAGAIPWLLLEIAGRQAGPMGGSTLLQTTYIHRVNTAGGVAPLSGCTESTYGAIALVPYTTDYYFYRQASSN